MNVEELSEGLRRDLLHYLATSGERAWLIGDLIWRNPAMADFLGDLEADDDLRTRVEIESLRSLATSGQASGEG